MNHYSSTLQSEILKTVRFLNPRLRNGRRDVVDGGEAGLLPAQPAVVPACRRRIDRPGEADRHIAKRERGGVEADDEKRDGDRRNVRAAAGGGAHHPVLSRQCGGFRADVRSLL